MIIYSVILICAQILFTATTNASMNNVLLIIIDDLRHLSNENVNLPNIKEMANKGVNFKNAFSQVSQIKPYYPACLILL